MRMRNFFVLLVFGIFCCGAFSSLYAQEKEFVFEIPAPVAIEYRVFVGGRTILLSTEESGNLVAFRSLHLMDHRGAMIVTQINIGPEGFSSAFKNQFDKLDFGAEEVKLGKGGPPEPPKPKVVEKGFFEEALLGAHGYYLKRSQDAPPFLGEGDFLAHLKKTSQVFEEDPKKILENFFRIADEEVVIIEGLIEKKVIQKNLTVLLEGFIGLYKSFKKKSLGGAVLPPTQIADPKSALKKEPTLSVEAKGKLPTTWGNIKKGGARE